MDLTIVGAGVVGSATGHGFEEHGHLVRYVDANPDRVDQLRREGREASVPDKADYTAGDISMISVNTPTIDGRVDVSRVVAAAERIGQSLRWSDSPHTVVVRSTVPPGTTKGIVRHALEAASGRSVGDGLGLAMNPEFLRQRNAAGDFLNPWLTVFGAEGAREIAQLYELYEPFGAPIVTTDIVTAETIKYAHNLYNATKISFFNEFHLVAQRLGVDSETIGEVVARSAEGMWRPEYGTRGGRPYDGACLPKDTVGFLTFAREQGMEMPLLEATIHVNETMERVAPPEHATPDSASPVSMPSRSAEAPMTATPGGSAQPTAID